MIHALEASQAARLGGKTDGFVRGDCYRREVSGICCDSAKRAGATHMGQCGRHRAVAVLRAARVASTVRRTQAGQFYASQAQIAVDLHWTRKTVGTALQRLAGKALLDVETSGKGTVITVTHWDEISSGRGFQEIECLGEEQPVQIIAEAYEEEPLWESR